MNSLANIPHLAALRHRDYRLNVAGGLTGFAGSWAGSGQAVRRAGSVRP